MSTSKELISQLTEIKESRIFSDSKVSFESAISRLTDAVLYLLNKDIYEIKPPIIKTEPLEDSTITPPQSTKTQNNIPHEIKKPELPPKKFKYQIKEKVKGTDELIDAVYFTVEGDTIEEVKAQAQKGATERGWGTNWGGNKAP